MLFGFIVSLGLLLNLSPAAEERKQEMGIVLVAVGEIDRNVMDWLKNDLSQVFNKVISIRKGMPEPDYAFDQKRKQYSSTAILKAIMKQREYAPYEKILGVVDHDLFVPELNPPSP
jgi:predicted Zn-dependent protease